MSNPRSHSTEVVDLVSDDTDDDVDVDIVALDEELEQTREQEQRQADAERLQQQAAVSAEAATATVSAEVSKAEQAEATPAATETAATAPAAVKKEGGNEKMKFTKGWLREEIALLKQKWTTEGPEPWNAFCDGLRAAGVTKSNRQIQIQAEQLKLIPEEIAPTHVEPVDMGAIAPDSKAAVLLQPASPPPPDIHVAPKPIPTTQNPPNRWSDEEDRLLQTLLEGAKGEKPPVSRAQLARHALAMGLQRTQLAVERRLRHLGSIVNQSDLAELEPDDLWPPLPQQRPERLPEPQPERQPEQRPFEPPQAEKAQLEQLQPEQPQSERQQPEQLQPERQQPEQPQPERQQPEQPPPEQLQPEQLQPEEGQPEARARQKRRLEEGEPGEQHRASARPKRTPLDTPSQQSENAQALAGEDRSRVAHQGHQQVEPTRSRMNLGPIRHFLQLLQATSSAVADATTQDAGLSCGWQFIAADESVAVPVEETTNHLWLMSCVNPKAATAEHAQKGVDYFEDHATLAAYLQQQYNV